MATGDVIITGRTLAEPTYVPVGVRRAKATYPDLYSTMGIDIAGTFASSSPDVATVNTFAAGSNGTLYIVGGNSVDGEIYTSTDGATWTARSMPAGFAGIRDIIYENGYFLAGCDNGGVVYSTDGITWTSEALVIAAGGIINTVGYGDGFYIAGGSGGAYATCPTAPTGTWTERAIAGLSNAIYSYAYSPSLDIHVVGSSGGVLYTTSSVDGGTWTSRTNPFTGLIFSIAWGNGVFVGVGASGEICYSSDGIVWTAASNNAGTDFVRIVKFYDGFFTCITTTGIVQTSVDGITWTTVDVIADTIYGLAIGDDYIIVSASADAAYTAIRAESTDFYVPVLTVPTGYNAYVNS